MNSLRKAIALPTALAGLAIAFPAFAGGISPTLTAKLTAPTYTYSAESGSKIGRAHTVLSLCNMSHDTIKYRQAGLAVDWLIENSAGDVLYDANLGKMIPHYIALRLVRAGEHIDFPGDIPLQSQDGTALKPGRYTLVARYQAMPKREVKTTLTVK